jgi:hypothetical protein
MSSAKGLRKDLRHRLRLQARAGPNALPRKSKFAQIKFQESLNIF